MNDTPPVCESPIEIYLGDLDPEKGADLKIRSGEDVIIYIPLDSIGVTNSHIDICDDLLEAIWSAERLAANASHATVLSDYPPGTHKTRLKLELRDAHAGLTEAV